MGSFTDLHMNQSTGMLIAKLIVICQMEIHVHFIALDEAAKVLMSDSESWKYNSECKTR